jgi:hypothetical protein
MRPRRQVPRVSRGVARQFPAPVGGLNARDSVANMPASDALILDNIFPERSWVEVRRGYTSHATGMTGAVETLMDYNGPTPKLFAVANNSIFDASSAGAVGTAAVTGLTNNRFQFVNFTNAAASFLIAVNGADGVRTWNGTTWATQTITGVTAANLFCVTTWKRRVWFGEQGTTKAWYLATDAVSGAANAIDLGGVWRHGGAIAGIIAPTFDSSAVGLEDYIGFISTRGELALYRGTDPANPTTFELQGVFLLGAPIGRRFFIQTGGDFALMNVDGVVSLTQALGLDRSVVARTSVTDKITRLFTEAVQQYGSNFGWSLTVFPEGHRVIVNVPISTTVAIQYVMNTLSGAWCRYTNHNAACWATWQGNLYFGGQAGGIVYRADFGTSDNGNDIPWGLKTAFSDFKVPSRLKRFTLLRPLIQATDNPNASIALDVDYGDQPAQNVPSFTNTSALWDSAVWDVSSWGGTQTIRPWVSLGKIGYVGAVRMAGQTRGFTMQLSAFDIVFEPAQALGL